jgi:hypothetical protein
MTDKQLSMMFKKHRPNWYLDETPPIRMSSHPTLLQKELFMNDHPNCDICNTEIGPAHFLCDKCEKHMCADCTHTHRCRKPRTSTSVNSRLSRNQFDALAGINLGRPSYHFRPQTITSLEKRKLIQVSGKHGELFVHSLTQTGIEYLQAK